MIGKLRWKIVGINMLFVTAVMLAVFAGVFFSTRSNLESSTLQLLQQALSEDVQSLRPGKGAQPCFVAEVLPSGTVRVSSSSYYQMYSDEELLAIVQDCQQQTEPFGVLSEYHLYYLRSSGLLNTRIAFTDSTMEQTTLRSLTGSLALIMLVALSVLFAFSYLLSGLATRPVGQAWLAQKRFLSDASHELKTPLTVILSSADLLAEEMPPPQQRYVDNIRAEGQRMKSLVEDMLTLSRAEGQGQQSPHAPQDFSDLVTDTALLFEPVAYEARHPLEYDIAPALCVSGNADALRQLLGILLDNAIKYAAQGSPVRLSLTAEGRNALLLVENAGEPIPSEKLSHLFERFYRAEESRSGPNGFGLGLSIAQAIVRQHDGTIRCESDARSTRFYVTIPLCK